MSCHVSHGQSWAGTGNGCSKTICRRQCGSAFCGVLCPPSHKWPVAQGQGRSTSAAHRHRSPAPHSGRQPPTVVPEPPRPNRTPEAVAEAAAEEIVQLESAVAALGEGNPLAKPLLAALKVARSKVNVPVSVQIEMSEKHLARARKRLVVANEELEKAVEKKNSFTSDVEATELRLARLRASVPTPMNQEPAAVAELPYRRIDPRARCAQVRSSACGRPSGHVAREWSRRGEHVAHFRGKSSPRARCVAGGIGPATCRGSFSVDVDIDRSRRFSCERTLQPSHVRVISAR